MRGGPAGAIALAGSGGGALALAFEPYAVLPLVVVGPTLFVLALDDASLRRSVVLGFVFGLSFQGLLLWWLTQSIGPAAWAAVVLVQAAWFGALGFVAYLTRRLPVASVWFGLAWVTAETARSTWPWGGLPWGRIGFAVLDTPWSGLLPVLGVAGTGVLLATVAAALADAVRLAGRARIRGLLGASLLLVLGLVPALGARSGQLDSSVVVAVVQGGVPGDGRQLAANHRQVTDNHALATMALARRVEQGATPRPDIVVWPENSTAVDPMRDGRARAAIESAVEAIGVPVVVGAMVDGPTPDTVLNQGIVWAGSGPSAATYTKHHPVPFGEYIPFRRYLGSISPRLAEIRRDMLPGTSVQPLDVDGTTVADAICFDVAYDDVIAAQVRNGAELVIVQTSNASFTGTAQLDQQFAMTRARALETQRAVAVASTNGITALIAPDGTVIERAPRERTAVLSARLPVSDDVTPAVRWETVPARIAVLLSLVGAVVGAWKLGAFRVLRRRTVGTTGRAQG
ncbi:apolipoprotein N-acyltransferase [Nocardioides currus]|uniref:apolipoprotein N-acyltransferase n=1 Tax=Nocardioides currus TaxID=2133958 RepID=UPI002434601A|nr:apolipoprotein N-acyltransferase [Nocardioides currus]